jgi:hypothetical protein
VLDEPHHVDHPARVVPVPAGRPLRLRSRAAGGTAASEDSPLRASRPRRSPDAFSTAVYLGTESRTRFLTVPVSAREKPAQRAPWMAHRPARHSSRSCRGSSPREARIAADRPWPIPQAALHGSR